MAEGIDWCWRFVPELFEVDDCLEEMIARQTVPDPRTFETEYYNAIEAVLAEAQMALPPDQRPILGGRRGHHSEHLGHLLAVMQYLAAHLPGRRLVMAEHFHALEVAEIIPETDEALSIRFRVPPELADTFSSRRGSI